MIAPGTGLIFEEAANDGKIGLDSTDNATYNGDLARLRNQFITHNKPFLLRRKLYDDFTESCVKFIPPQTRITLRLHKQDDKHVFINNENDTEYQLIVDDIQVIYCIVIRHCEPLYHNVRPLCFQLILRRITVTHPFATSFAKKRLTTPILLPYESKSVKIFHLPSGSQNQIIRSINQGISAPTTIEVHPVDVQSCFLPRYTNEWSGIIQSSFS